MTTTISMDVASYAMQQAALDMGRLYIYLPICIVFGVICFFALRYARAYNWDLIWQWVPGFMTGLIAAVFICVSIVILVDYTAVTMAPDLYVMNKFGVLQ